MEWTGDASLLVWLVATSQKFASDGILELKIDVKTGKCAKISPKSVTLGMPNVEKATDELPSLAKSARHENVPRYLEMKEQRLSGRKRKLDGEVE